MAKKLMFMGVLFLLVLSLINCGGGGGGGGGDATSPALSVSKINDFGDTAVNDSAVQQVTVTNSGTAALKISNVTLTPVDGFELLPGTCGNTPITINAKKSCTFSVAFNPTAAKVYNSTLKIFSNAKNSPLTLALTGTGVALPAAVKVDLKEVVCDAGQLKAYAQVWDEKGDAIIDLLAADFGLVIDGAAPADPASISYLNAATANLPISVAFLMDYSGSITGDPQQVDDMQTTAKGFINGLEANDEAEIIKFTGTPYVAQAYTTDKALLRTAINANYVPPDDYTALYDALGKALEDTNTRPGETQRAIVIITDGIDAAGDDTASVNYTKEDVITLAQDGAVKIFTVAIGTKTNDLDLREIAEDTGGQFFKVEDSTELATSVNDKLLVLLQDAYEILFANPTAGTELAVEVTRNGITSLSNIDDIPNCP